MQLKAKNDWTFTTDYCGSYYHIDPYHSSPKPLPEPSESPEKEKEKEKEGGEEKESKTSSRASSIRAYDDTHPSNQPLTSETDQSLNIDLLTREDPILFNCHLMLYEDELRYCTVHPPLNVRSTNGS